MEPEPFPPPEDVVTLIETTDGVTRDAIVFASIVDGEPITMGVRLLEHVPLLAR